MLPSCESQTSTDFHPANVNRCPLVKDGGHYQHPVDGGNAFNIAAASSGYQLNKPVGDMVRSLLTIGETVH